MERKRRVYPAQYSRDGWLSYLLLFLSAIVVMSGLVFRPDGEKIWLSPVATATPVPLDEAFDETRAEQEFTLPSGTWYALQLGAFENEQAAAEVAERFARRGAAGYVWNDGRYRALAAVYSLREEAQNVRRQLEELHSVDTYLYEIELPAVALRMKGMKGQLEILQAAFAHAMDLVENLQSLSVAMDRQEKNVSEALEELRALDDQIQVVSLRLAQRFSSPRHQTVEAMIRYFADFSAFYKALDGETSEVGFGMQLKRQTLASLDLLTEVYDTLYNT